MMLTERHSFAKSQDKGCWQADTGLDRFTIPIYLKYLHFIGKPTLQVL